MFLLPVFVCTGRSEGLVLRPDSMFPKDPVGAKLVGTFKALKGFDGQFFLIGDSSAGQKDKGRAFYPLNVGSLKDGQTYTYTEQTPLIIKSIKGMGRYAVALTANVPPKALQDLQDLAEAKHEGPYYRPADKFPKDARGIRLVGKFRVRSSPSYPQMEPWLEADSSRGEKNNSRMFKPINTGRLRRGDAYEFTSEQPLIVSDKGVMGIYDVIFPRNYLSAAEQKQRQIQEQQASDQEIASRRIDTELKPLYLSQKQPAVVVDKRKHFPREVEPFGGFGSVPWGSAFEDVVLGGAIDPGQLFSLFDTSRAYASLAAKPTNEVERSRSLVELYDAQEKFIKEPRIGVIACMPQSNDQHYLNNGNSVLSIAGLKTIPEFGIAKGYSGQRTLTYLFCDGKLYAAIVEPLPGMWRGNGRPLTPRERSDQERKDYQSSLFQPIGAQPPPALDTAGMSDSGPVDYLTYNAAFELKYGKPEILLREINGLGYVFKRWSNDKGTIVMVVKPRAGELGLSANKFLMQAGEALMREKIAQSSSNLSVAEAAVMKSSGFEDWINDLTDNTFGQASAIIAEQEKQLVIAAIYYYSNDAMSSADEKIARFRERKKAAQERLAEATDRQINQSATSVLDDI